jgi:voltage-gated potassium channel
VVTLFTVGYGDMYWGRAAGVVLMISGIALFGGLTASLASLFVEKEDKVVKKGDHQHLRERLDELAQSVQRIEKMLFEQQTVADDADDEEPRLGLTSWEGRSHAS